ncbi:hypothetical protein [Rhizobium mongolense]|uniref:Uncharacterized protein n=2 Tax=Rhizobium mongolense TaxID=57676 RepID=A0ABR6ILF1_9HYPH|nr:hypothetical protein [Rhizobium mongolense]MBB4228687.1 hypothetical protein [Rhizobium mongolense]TVZ63722.1 hypothetical protein BCL32_3891 [Rhizobium mongolense USDA 1844]
MPEDVPNSTEPQRGPAPIPDAPDRVQEKPPLKPAHDPSDDKNPNDPSPVDPALLPIGDPAGAA